HPPLVFDSLFLSSETCGAGVYTLSLHDALPILEPDFDQLRAELDALLEAAGPVNAVLRFLVTRGGRRVALIEPLPHGVHRAGGLDRKSTRLNSSHVAISYAVFCLKKKKRSKEGH